VQRLILTLLGAAFAVAGALAPAAADARSPRAAKPAPVAADRHAAATPAARRAVRPATPRVVPAHAAAARATPARSAALRGGRTVGPHAARMVKVSAAPKWVAPQRASIGQASGLHSVDDPLDLRSSVALVVDQRSGETLFAKNSLAVLPIASITKLMTAMVVLDANLPMSEVLEVTDADIDLEKGSRSRLRPGTRLTRAEMLNLALMSSENRAAHALGRQYPGGLGAFVQAMNEKAKSLAMTDSSFVDPTGLSSRNVSNARDLSRMVRAAFEYPLIRQYSTATELTVDTGSRTLSFHSTNRLVDDPGWAIGLQKTGYISEAGRCLVMQASIEGRPLVLVLLDSQGRLSRFGDAQRLRNWLEKENDARRAPAQPSARAATRQASLGS